MKKITMNKKKNCLDSFIEKHVKVIVSL